MKKYLSLWLTASVLFLVSSCRTGGDKPDTATSEPGKIVAENSDMPDHRYSLESAIVTTTMQLPGGMGSNVTILYFKDHGKKEIRENITSVKMAGKEMSTRSRILVRDGYVYTWVVGQQAGNKFKLQDKFDPSKLDYKKLSKEMMEKFKMTKEGTADVQGKTCDVFSFEAEGMKGKSYIWENIPMKTEMSMSGKTLTAEVTKLEEGADIPDSEFELPAGVEFTEIQAPQAMNP